MDLDRTTIIAGPKIKMVRDAVREMARHDMNDSGWTVTSLADQMNISPTHAEWLSEILVEQKILERKSEPETFVFSEDRALHKTVPQEMALNAEGRTGSQIPC